MARAEAEAVVDDELVYRQYAPELIRFAQGLVGYDDAADVMATAFVKAMRSPAWPTVVERRPYLFRTVYNEAQTVRRRRARSGQARPRSELRCPGVLTSRHR